MTAAKQPSKKAGPLIIVTAVMGAAGFTLIQDFEGTHNEVYLDPVGIPTVCTGHTGPEVKMGDTWTDEECDAALHSDIAKHRAGFLKCVNAPMSNNQLDAFTSFTFNVGVGAACRSTLARKARSGDLTGACNELPRWNKAGGRVLRGLTRRRAAEQRLCLKASPEASSTADTLKRMEMIEELEQWGS